MAKLFGSDVEVLENESVTEVKNESDLGLELFRGELELEMKKFEKKHSEAGNEYAMFYFDTCVRFDKENQRNNRYILVPLYCSMEVARKCLGGIKNLVGKRYRISVVFTPSIYKGKDGSFFTNFRAEIEEIQPLFDIENDSMI